MLKLVKTIKNFSMLSLICCGLSSFAIQPENTINVLDYGAVGDGAVDSTTAIQNAIDVAKGNSAIDGIYFPVGTYKITNKITFKSGISLHGDDSGVALIKADTPVTIGAPSGSDPKLTNMNVEDLFFKNISIGFYAWGGGKRTNINIKRCVFSATSSAYNPNSSLVGYSRTSGGSIQDCIFLRQKESPGAAMSAWRSSDLIIDRNIVGLNLTDTQWLDTEWPGATNWIAPDARIQEFKTMENLKDNQGHYRRGLEASGSLGSLTIRQNIYNGTEFISTWKDHVMYIHNNTANVVMTQNWMRGWPNGAQGGLKIRNNSGPVVVAANRFKNTPILGYIHRGSGTAIGVAAGEVYIGTFVYRNIFDYSMNPSYGGIGFWDKASEKGGLGIEENNEYAENTFNTPNNTASFWFRSGDASGHKIYVSNYHSDGTLVESSGQEIPLTIGVPDLEKTAPYEDLEIPEYNIPFYTEPKIEISEDAYIRGGSYASTNYNASTMVVKNDSNNFKWNRQILLKVDLSQVEDIGDYQDISLNFCTANIVSANDTISAYFYNDSSWSESTVTYNDITQVTTPALASVTSLATETWYKLDITEKALEQIQNGNTVFTIMLKASTGGYNKVYSSESSNKPFVKLR